MVSVVIPVHNAEAFLAETLDSVYAQRDSGIPLEIVAVDDRSTDGSRRVLEEWAENHGDISLRIIDNENAAGPAGARNTGIRDSSGRYLSFLDSDDLWLPDKIRCQVEFMKERECSFSFTSYDFGDEQGHSTGRTVRAPEKLDYRHALTRTVIFTSTVMFDREKIPKDILVMPDVPSEDTALWWKVMRNGYTACGIDRIFTIYRRSGNTLSSDKVEACRRIWNLYRSVEGLSLVRSAACFVMWAARATLRRI